MARSNDVALPVSVALPVDVRSNTIVIVAVLVIDVVIGVVIGVDVDVAVLVIDTAATTAGVGILLGRATSCVMGR